MFWTSSSHLCFFGQVVPQTGSFQWWQHFCCSSDGKEPDENLDLWSGKKQEGSGKATEMVDNRMDTVSQKLAEMECKIGAINSKMECQVKLKWICCWSWHPLIHSFCTFHQSNSLFTLSMCSHFFWFCFGCLFGMFNCTDGNDWEQDQQNFGIALQSSES